MRPRGSECGTIQKETSLILQLLTIGAARRILQFYLAQIKGRKKAATVGAKAEKFTAG